MNAIDSLQGVGYEVEQARQDQVNALSVAAGLARQAHKDGHSISEIARAAGVSRPTIYQWIKEQT